MVLNDLAQDVSVARSSDPHPVRYVGRQPIFDAEQRIFGYELLFRTSMVNCFSGDSVDATRKMIDTILLLGKETLAGKGKAFVNFTRQAITERLTTLLPAQSTVVEVLETVVVDDEVFAACVELKQLGYRIALDDFIPGTTSERLVQLADYIKMDFRAWSPAELTAIRDRLEGTGAALLAEKVETEAEFHQAADQGYRFFQGYFFARPTILQNRVLPPNQMVYMQILSAVSREQPDHEAIARLVMAEASLSFRVLRSVNSAAMGMRNKITSIRHAILLLGVDQLRKVVTVAIATNLGAKSGAQSELILLALKRARFCKLMAGFTRQPPGEQYLIGLISVFNIILQMPMETVLEMLPLSPEASGALLGHDRDDPAGISLRLVQAYEQQLWQQCFDICRDLHISEARLTDIYVVALNWAADEIRIAGM